MTRPEELAQACLPRLTREETALIAAAIRKAVGEALMEAVTAGELGQHCEPTYVNVDRIFAIRDRWCGDGE